MAMKRFVAMMVWVTAVSVTAMCGRVAAAEKDNVPPDGLHAKDTNGKELTNDK
jgi:hypothetical protein